MKILILFQFSNHNQTIDSLCDNLNKKGIDTSSFNTSTWRFRSKERIKFAPWLYFLRAITTIPVIRGLISKII